MTYSPGKPENYFRQPHSYNTVATLIDRGVNGATPAKIYVVTSDAEKAIRSGLELSILRLISLHFTCSLHAKWSAYSNQFMHDVIDII